MTTQLVRHLRGRVVHGIVREHRGIVASRICALLEVRGRLESDAIADGAMVPAKDVREVCTCYIMSVLLTCCSWYRDF